MRFALAIIALVFSGVLLVLGIGQRTFLAGPAEITITTELPEGSSYASIPAEALANESGIPFVEVTGTDAFIATGATRDVEAWLAPLDHVTFSPEATSDEWVFTTVSESTTNLVENPPASGESDGGQEPKVYDPRGSDLWIAETSPNEDSESSVRLPVSVDEKTSLLVSVNTESDSQNTVSLVWKQDTRTPYAGPLIVSGIFFAVLGAVLYLLAVDHDRRGLGPRRGQKGPFWGIRNFLRGSQRGKKSSTSDSPDPVRREIETPTRASGSSKNIKRMAAPALALSSMLVLSGCSAEYWPEFSQLDESQGIVDEAAQTTTAAPNPVTAEQIDRIIADVAQIAAAADDALDPALLSDRFTGDALTQRTASYTVRASVPDYKVVPPRITDEALEYELVQSTEGWPRTVFVTVASEPGTPVNEESAENAEEIASPSLAVIMTQASPHDNFLVSRVVALRGGITMPEAAPAEEGTALLADDLQSLVLPPGEVGPAYAAILAGGTGVEQAALFNLDGDTLIERSGAAWAAQSQATADAAEQGVRYSVTATQTETPIVSLSTGVGGALVATTIIEERIEEPGSGRWKPTPPPSVTALSGLSGQQDRLVSVVTHQLLFYVPGKESNEKIQLLGYSSDLTGARNS